MRVFFAKELAPEAIDLAVRAYVRHAHTRYDELMGRGWRRLEARAEVAEEIERVLDWWLSKETWA